MVGWPILPDIFISLMRKLFLLMLAALPVCQLTARSLRVGCVTQPFLPIGKTIVFTFKAICIPCPAVSGTATPLTACRARFLCRYGTTYDSKSIAQHRRSVWQFWRIVIPATGGEAKELLSTLHRNIVQVTMTIKLFCLVLPGWILASNRAFLPVPARLYKVSINGGRVGRYWPHLLKSETKPAMSKMMLYQDKRGRKYLAQTPYILYSPRYMGVRYWKGTHRKITTFNGDDRSPCLLIMIRLSLPEWRGSGSFQRIKWAWMASKTRQLAGYKTPSSFSQR